MFSKCFLNQGDGGHALVEEGRGRSPVWLKLHCQGMPCVDGARSRSHYIMGDDDCIASFSPFLAITSMGAKSEEEEEVFAVEGRAREKRKEKLK